MDLGVISQISLRDFIVSKQASAAVQLVGEFI